MPSACIDSRGRVAPDRRPSPVARGAGRALDRRGRAVAPRDREGCAMIEHRRPDRDEPSDDPAEGMRCALLDEYEEVLRRRPDPDPQGWASDRGISDRTLVLDLEVLKRLHGLNRSASGQGAGTRGAAEPPVERVALAGAASPWQIGRYLVLEWLDSGARRGLPRAPSRAGQGLRAQAGPAADRAGRRRRGRPGRARRRSAARGGCWPSATIPTWSGSSTSTSTRAGRSWSWSTCPA